MLLPRQSHDQTRALGVKYPHALKQQITETLTKDNQTDTMVTTFSTKTRTRIGCWNVKTMMEITTLAQIDKERNTYHIEILGLSDTQWNGSGEHRIPQGGILLYSGKPINDKHESGVGILLSPKAHKSLIEWKPILDRIIMARFLTKLRKLVVIQCYAPTEQAVTEEKDAFYETLENTLRNVKRSEITMVMGDLNAKVGADNKNFEHTMGRHGLGTMNENGERFAELCSNNNLVIGGTLFPHKQIHKVTWGSPNQTTQNQIDRKRPA